MIKCKKPPAKKYYHLRINFFLFCRNKKRAFFICHLRFTYMFLLLYARMQKGSNSYLKTPLVLKNWRIWPIKRHIFNRLQYFQNIACNVTYIFALKMKTIFVQKVNLREKPRLNEKETWKLHYMTTVETLIEKTKGLLLSIRLSKKATLICSCEINSIDKNSFKLNLTKCNFLFSIWKELLLKVEHHFAVELYYRHSYF